MSTVTVVHCGFEGSGATVTEAKRDAARVAERVAREHRGPIFTRPLCGFVAVVFPDVSPSGLRWHYSIQRLDGWRDSPCYISGGADRDEVLRGAKRHVADNAWDGTNDAECLAFVDAADRKDMMSRWAWQRRAREAQAAGMDAEAARAYADGRSPLAEVRS